MSNYEILYIINSEISEEEQPKIMATFEELVKKAEGKIISTENLGKKKLAYPINKMKVGFYVLSQFELESEKLIELNKKLKPMNEIIRFMIVSKEPAKEEEEKPKSPQSGIPSAGKVSISPVFKKEVPVFKKEVEEKEKPAQGGSLKGRKKEEKKEKVSIEELDAKLDEILQDDIIEE